MSKIIEIQEYLRPALPPVFGCKDYAQEKQLLERVDRILLRSGVERLFLELSREKFEAGAAKMKASGREVQTGGKALERYLRHSRQALRCTVLKGLVGGGYRQMSKTLAIAPLYRWFCGLKDFEKIQVPGKSTLRDYAHWLAADKMEQILATLTRAVADEASARLIGLESELDMTAAWVDTTCLKACIHFPIDWVLLRDAARTLVKSILCIRRHGLRRRIPEPEGFLREINALAMGMSAAGRRGRPGGKRERKRVLRAMKKVSKVVEEHGRRYREALDLHWEQESDLTRKEVEVILRRMDNVLDQLPDARRQAHERIIGGRKVANAQKILSLYESDLHVIVRGKAGAEVEFGNGLYLAESVAGFIFDHELAREMSRGDARWLARRYPQMQEKCGGGLCAVVADRAFASEANRQMLEREGVFDVLCPRDPAQLSRRLETDAAFASALRRRGQTEGRVSIFKNKFLGGIPLAKGFENRQLQVAWAVLTHNLWVTARQPWLEEKEQRLRAA